MDYLTITFYLALVMIAGSLAEIVARKKERVKEERNSKGRIISDTRSIRNPVLLLIVSIITAIATRFIH
ncbi:MAG: hypothetical protein D4S02_13700 [Rhodocyclaceae bacterium]|nr:MAG: hypothetical protein D4S02_13700 [Rhodocyclaceae bacterium]